MVGLFWLVRIAAVIFLWAFRSTVAFGALCFVGLGVWCLAKAYPMLQNGRTGPAALVGGSGLGFVSLAIWLMTQVP